MQPRFVCVLDWDHSAVVDNTDVVVPRHIASALESGGAPPLRLSDFLSARAGTPWTQLMDEVAGMLHGAGATPAHYDAALQTVSLWAGFGDTLRSLSASGGLLAVISDANTVYIRHGLTRLGVDLPDGLLLTNPASFSPAGRLSISPHASTPHGCPRKHERRALCPPNLCKGRVLKGLALRVPVVYVGDGLGDLCAVLSLRSGDCVLARRGFPLHAALLSREVAGQVQCRVVAWGDGGELQDGLRAFAERHSV